MEARGPYRNWVNDGGRAAFFSVADALLPNGDAGVLLPKGDADVAPPKGDADVAPPNGDADVALPNGAADVALPNGDADAVLPNGLAEAFPPNGLAGTFPPNPGVWENGDAPLGMLGLTKAAKPPVDDNDDEAIGVPLIGGGSMLPKALALPNVAWLAGPSPPNALGLEAWPNALDVEAWPDAPRVEA